MVSRGCTLQSKLFWLYGYIRYGIKISHFQFRSFRSLNHWFTRLVFHLDFGWYKAFWIEIEHDGKRLKLPDKYSVISKMITHDIIIMHYCALPIYTNSNDTVVYLDVYYPQTHVALVSMPMLYIKAQIYHDRFYLHNRYKTMAWICK